jgi:hypothetical protein
MHISLYRSAALSLALAAMLLRALLPDGWMPSDQAGGAFFTICSVEHGRHEGKAPQSDSHTHAPCAFAAAATLAPPEVAKLAFGASTPGWRVAAQIAVEQPAPAAPHRPNAARAPPIFA